MFNFCITLVPGGMAEVLQTLRGVALVTAVTLLAELGDLTRFEGPRQLMAHLGLVPREDIGFQTAGGDPANMRSARRSDTPAKWS